MVGEGVTNEPIVDMPKSRAVTFCCETNLSTESIAQAGIRTIAPSGKTARIALVADGLKSILSMGSLTNLVCALGGKTLTRSQIHPAVMVCLLKHQSATGGEIMNRKYQNGPRHANAFFFVSLWLKGFFHC